MSQFTGPMVQFSGVFPSSAVFRAPQSQHAVRGIENGIHVLQGG